jgi:acetate kinase
MRTLVINAGSTSVKLSVLDGEQEQFATTVEHQSPAEAVESGLTHIQAAGLLDVDAVGHRIVHGAQEFTEGVQVNEEVLTRLNAINDLAPLHNPPALKALAEARKHLPNVPHIVAFDTAFHRHIWIYTETYPVPRQWTDEWGIRKYGFHGLSHAYCSRKAREMLHPSSYGDRIIVAHLGGGCSLCAVWDGKSVDTTMGFTPLDGLMMATRCGSIDPSIIIHVMRHHGLSVDEVEDLLSHKSGLFGVCGHSDLREVWQAASGGSQEAHLALDMFSYRARLGIASMAASMNGIDTIVFTGGIGEHDAQMRAFICEGLEFMGMRIDSETNKTAKPDADISHADSQVRILLIHTREDVSIVREIERILKS